MEIYKNLPEELRKEDEVPNKKKRGRKPLIQVIEFDISEDFRYICVKPAIGPKRKLPIRKPSS